MENARPQTAGEEELQLQLALAMSKEEAEQEERLRRNDDLRLQMALTESKDVYKRVNSEDGESDGTTDLLALCSSPLSTGASKQDTDPWGMPVSNVSCINIKKNTDIFNTIFLAQYPCSLKHFHIRFAMLSIFNKIVNKLKSIFSSI